MASETMTKELPVRMRSTGRASDVQATAIRMINPLLKPLASLRLTVALFAMSIFIILVGTLAQVEMDMWDVMGKYFLSWFTWIPLQVFFPRSWFPQWQNVPGAIPFLGGASIGAGLAVNLVAAHLVRFKVQARGVRLLSGLAVFALGGLMTAAVIASGHNLEGLQGQPPFSWRTLWLLVKSGLVVLGLAAAAGSFWVPGRFEQRRFERISLVTLGVVLATAGAWLFVLGQEAYLGDAGMRILWQLIQSGFAGVVLLVACVLLFRKRGGVVLTHLGIGLLMFGQFWVAKHDVEEQMSLAEGETITYAYDIRKTELAVIDSRDPDVDRVVVVPQSILRQSQRLATASDEAGDDGLSWLGRLAARFDGWFHASPYVDEHGVIRHAELPFDIQVMRYYKNADLKDVGESSEDSLATDGTGLRMVALPARASSGTDGSGQVDLAAAYVRLLPKDGEGRVDEAVSADGGESTDAGASSALGTYLVSQLASAQGIDENVSVGNRSYDVALRFQRSYKPYSITLVDVRKDDYLGTRTPRNYSSDIHLVDSARGVDRQIHIWMNNPLRYAGETFYQSGYSGPPEFPIERTTLSVVTNSGWMIPYVACMLVAVGLPAHFLVTLLRFLRRRSEEQAAGHFDVTAQVVDNGATARPAKARSRGGARGHRASGVAKPPRRPLGAGELAEVLVPVIVVGLFAILFYWTARPLSAPHDDLNLRAFGSLPVIAEGRVKPFDTLARNTLRVVSNKESFTGRMDPARLDDAWDSILADLQRKWPEVDAGALQQLPRGDVDAVIELIQDETDDHDWQIAEYVDKQTSRSYPAIRWLLDVIARPEAAEQHKVFRIDNLEVLDTLGIQRRKGHRYSVKEIRGGVVEFERQVEQARKQDVDTLSTFQRKLLDLDRRVRAYTRLGASFQLPQLPPLPTRAEFERDRDAAIEQMTQFQQAYVSFLRGIESIQPPLAVPVEKGSSGIPDEPQEDEDGYEWESYATAAANAFVTGRLLGSDPPESLSHLTKIILAYEAQDAAAFNSEVERYERFLARNTPEQLDSQYGAGASLSLTGIFNSRVIEPVFDNFYGFESYYNRVSPFFFCSWPYLAAFLLTAMSWLGWSKPLNRAAFCLILFTFLIHTLALAARIYISGRPPVTNLYSSAVFIGWAGVVFGLVLERMFRNSIGNVVAATAGFSTMIIAYNLAGDGDTFTVLQAVLDTQFWLTTHVVCITLGYAATFVAGLIGLAYILGGLFVPVLDSERRRAIARMIYGVLCFAIFFSFIGTVLGGLWADDSWGRFWGWDPKENGALMIVLWVALVLHARWGGIVKERGLALLAVGGNIVTAWSWFGVNELGVGLHSYGFTEGVLLALGLFVVSQMVVIVAGLLPTRFWLSYMADEQRRNIAAHGMD